MVAEEGMVEGVEESEGVWVEKEGEGEERELS